MVNMGSEAQQLHVALFPFMAHGHMIPTLDIARLFASRGVKATIITTPLNVPTFTIAIGKANKIGPQMINIEVFEFPSQEAGLPEGCESVELAAGPEFIQRFFKATTMLSEQLDRYLEKVHPNCLIADMFFPWATDSAAKFNIPRLVFHGINFFALCAGSVIRRYKPHEKVSSDEEPFVLPCLPHQIKLTKLQLSNHEKLNDEESDFGKLRKQMIASEAKSFGVIVNSFYELEPDYAEFFRKELGRKAWHIGPVSLCNKSIDEMVHRGRQASIDEHSCLKWLNSKKPHSVIYICFGSTVQFLASQLREIAMALEALGREFLWVVRNTNEDWLLEGFEHRMEGKGLIIRGWAPQVMILEHEAIGAFMTHCGWNSTLEGIAAGVPMVTWPVFAEQFLNEKLVTQILEIGLSLGAKKWSLMPSVEDVIKHDTIEKALREILEGVLAEERRSRGNKLKEMARRALEEGGSSYSDLSALIDDLRNYYA